MALSFWLTLHYVLLHAASGVCLEEPPCGFVGLNLVLNSCIVFHSTANSTFLQKNMTKLENVRLLPGPAIFIAEPLVVIQLALDWGSAGRTSYNPQGKLGAEQDPKPRAPRTVRGSPLSFSSSHPPLGHSGPVPLPRLTHTCKAIPGRLCVWAGPGWGQL